MKGCKSVSIPMSQGTIMQLKEDYEVTNATLYKCLVGKLLYLTHSRPDIVFTVNVLSRSMANPTKIQLWVAKKVLRYLAGTKELGI